MDYDSEEEQDEDADDGEDKEEPAEQAEEDLDRTPGVSCSDFRKGKSLRGLNQPRVNSVLQSNAAIEGYSYDSTNELWCEVSLDAARGSEVNMQKPADQT